MDGSELVFIVMPIVIPLALGIMVALPFVADRIGGAHRERGRGAGAGRDASSPRPACGNSRSDDSGCDAEELRSWTA